MTVPSLSRLSLAVTVSPGPRDDKNLLDASTDAALHEVVDSIVVHTGTLLDIVNYNVEVRSRSLSFIFYFKFHFF